MNNISALKKKLDLIGKRKVKNILLVQPIQISEKKLDIKISLNKRYYMYPPYALGILNTVLKKNNYNSSITDWTLKFLITFIITKVVILLS